MPRLITVVLCALLLPSLAAAEVVRLRIERREVVLSGKAFGAAGPYEKLVGKVDFALDPTLPQNRGIVDLALAPRNARGLVEFSADFYLLKPVDPARGNGRLFYEAGNRGTKRILARFRTRSTPPIPTTAAEFGNGALMRQGFTLLWMGWQWDVPRAACAWTSRSPPTTGARSRAGARQLHPGRHATTASVADRGHQAYPVVDPRRGAPHDRAHAADRSAAARSRAPAGGSPARAR